jgi:cold shock protein
MNRRGHGAEPGVVREWHPIGGWGVVVISSSGLPVWTHFSNLSDQLGGLLSEGQEVSIEYETPGQDGYPGRARAVRPA